MSNTYTHYPQDDEISRDALIEELESRGVPTKIVYHFEDDDKKHMIKKEIVDWNITVTWDNNEKENITVIPQRLSDAVHELLDKLEKEETNG